MRVVVTGGGVMNSITLSDLDKVSGKKTKEISSVLVETTQKMIKKKKKKLRRSAHRTYMEFT